MKPLRLGAIVCAVLFWGGSSRALAQKTAGPAVGGLALPDEPGAQQPRETGRSNVVPQGTASLYGVVHDTTGAVVPEARVLLEQGRSERVLLSGKGGEFDFSALPPGAYRIVVTAVGMESFVSPEIHLLAGSDYEMSEIFPPIGTERVDVRVEATEAEIATAQIALQEKQRILGVFPDFYTSYHWNAAPLTPKLKFQLALKSSTDPITFLVAGAVAGVQQASNTFPGYGQGGSGYAKRFGAAYADDVIANMIGGAILPTFLRQDPRYYYRGSGSKASRTWYAISTAFICKGDNGAWQPNYSGIGGSFAAGAIANLYHPAGDRSASLTVRNALIDTAGKAGTNLLHEFLLRGLTPNVPSYANGKP